MKIPRWLLVSLLGLSAFAVLGAGAWWWVTWPERTATQFCDLIRDRKFDDACVMCDPTLTTVLNKYNHGADIWLIQADIRETRNPPDILFGRHGVDLFVGTAQRGETLNLVAERGRMVLR